jgi:hypothetical protein
METSDPQAKWPPHIGVHAYLALDGAPLMDATAADGAPTGTFVLRNAFGPRVLRCTYNLLPGEWWWPAQVVLDGRDVTNVPTDFTEHEGGRLEIVFTNRPARIIGRVVDEQGRPARAPWILLLGADRRLWQQWATTTVAAQGNTTGRFSLPALPGRYFVRALPQTAFTSWNAAQRAILQIAPSGVTVQLDNEKVKILELRATP